MVEDENNMRISALYLIVLLLISLTSSVIAQKTITITQPIPPPGNILLLPGYVHEPRRGIDSRVGVIYKKDGLSIGYDIGKMAANYAYQYFPEHFEELRKRTHLNSDANEREIKFLQDKVEWRRRQKISGNDLMLVLLKDTTLIASFVGSDTNFIAKIDSNDKLVDFLLIVLTYQPTLDKTSANTNQATTTVSSKGLDGINPLEGYTLEKGRGIDAAVGSFARTDGFKINYLIGGNVDDSSVYHSDADEASIVSRKQQWVGTNKIYLTSFQDGRLKAFFRNARANFYAETKSSQDSADFLLTVMQYSPAPTTGK